MKEGNGGNMTISQTWMLMATKANLLWFALVDINSEASMGAEKLSKELKSWLNEGLALCKIISSGLATESEVSEPVASSLMVNQESLAKLSAKIEEILAADKPLKLSEPELTELSHLTEAIHIAYFDMALSRV